MLAADSISVVVNKNRLLDQVSVRFLPGRINLVLGPNGAGKSTLIKVLSQQVQQYEGNVFYGETNLRQMTTSELARHRAVLSQNIDLAFPLTVKEVVMMGRYPHFNTSPAKQDFEIVNEAMDVFQITSMRDRNYLTLSGGEQQRVHFARVLAQIWDTGEAATRYLFLDEPLTFLDIYYQFQFMTILQQLLEKKNLLVVGVVHDLQLAARFGEQILLLKDGRILSSGPTTDVLTSDNIKTAFGLEPEVTVGESGGLRIFF